jgi:hypothetical protein
MLAPAFVLVPSIARAEPSASCAGVLSIDAAAVDAIRLGQELAAGILGALDAESCEGVRVTLTGGEESLHVSVEQGGRLVERDVDSLEHAAVWIESWLAPADSLPPAVATEEGSPESTAASSAPSHRFETRFELLGTVSLAGDLSMWMGPELAVTSRLTRAFWLGGGIGVPFWIQDAEIESTLNDDAPVMRLALRGGGRIELGDRLDLDLGAGLGITWDTQIDLPVNPFVELMSTLAVALGRGASLVVALLGRVHLLRDANRSAEVADGEGNAGEPPLLSILAGELRIGFTYTFGGAR